MNPAPHSKSLVIVDDEPMFLELLTLHLAANLTCPVHSFTKPLEALAALPNLHPGILVTDYDMPRLNGLELIAQAAALDPTLPAILITGRPLTQDSIPAARYPTLRIMLFKPFGWRTLADEIIRHWPEKNVQLYRTKVISDP